MVCAESFAKSSNKNVRLAVSTVFLNATTLLHESREELINDKMVDRMASLFGTICGSGLYEKEAMVRTLVAFGTVLLASENFKIKVKLLNTGSLLQRTASQHGDIVASIVEELQNVLGQ